MARGLATDPTSNTPKPADAWPVHVPNSSAIVPSTAGYDQCGSLGSGNHFLEVQVVDRVFDDEAARALGLARRWLCVMIHSGSRGLGYQVCDDALRALRGVPEKYGIELPDRQLACAPVHSPEGQHYLGGMRAAANFAWGNRQLLMWQAREVFERIFGRTWDDLGLTSSMTWRTTSPSSRSTTSTAWPSACGSTAKGRRGPFRPITRRFPPNIDEIGQPVLIPGDMGRASWVLLGQPGSMEQTFGSACHGAGRLLSRTAAAKLAHGRKIEHELRSRGVIAQARSWQGLAEEQPDAYKDVDLVVDVVHRAGLAKKVVRLRPIGVIKG